MAPAFKSYRVLYIGPYGFSGSTLLDLALAQADDVVSVGELFQLPRWVKENNLCTCRRHIRDCPFWGKFVPFGEGSLALSVTIPLPPAKLHALDDYRASPVPDDDEWWTYSKTQWTLFDAIAKETGARYIIDSSKHLWRLRALAMERPNQLHYLHLVRNPAAVARSARRSKSSPAVQGTDQFPGRTPSVPYPKTLVKWVLTHSASVRFSRQAKIQRNVIDFEEFTQNPETVLRGVCEPLDITFKPSMLTPGTITHHNVAGSRWRLKTERAVITQSGDRFAFGPMERALATGCRWLGQVSA